MALNVIVQDTGVGENLTGVAFADCSHGVAVGGSGTVVTTDDGGSTWTSRASGFSGGFRAVAFAGTRVVAVGDENIILLSDDGGETWQPPTFVPSFVSPADNLLSGIRFKDKNLGFAVGAAKDTDGVHKALLLVTRDGGSTWSDEFFPVLSDSANWLGDVAFIQGSDDFIIVGGGTTGVEGLIVQGAIGEDVGFTLRPSGVSKTLSGIAFADSINGWAVGFEGTIVHTADGGSTWTVQNSGVAGSHLLRVAALDASHAFIAGTDGVLLSTVDGGQTWIRVDAAGGAHLTDIVFCDSSRGTVVGTAGMVLSLGVDAVAVQTTTLTVRGRFLFDTANAKIILRGINLPLLDDWDFPRSDKLSELEKAGPNCVRIQWYKAYPNAGRPAYTAHDLDNFLARCAANRIIPILGLWDLTCNNDTSLVNSQLMSWWTTEPILSILQKHRKYIVLNLANELGVFRWAGNQQQQGLALQNYVNAYKTAIQSIRGAGLDMPVMIDAPDCGTSISAFTLIGKDLVDHDPKHNVLLSAHAYWAADDGTADIAKCIDANLPIVFGEIANKQAEPEKNDECFYDLDGSNQNNSPPSGFKYQDLLELLKVNDIGWMAWSWWKDGCANRQMTTTGSIANLTVYGSDIVNNPSYGLKNTAVRSAALV